MERIKGAITLLESVISLERVIRVAEEIIEIAKKERGTLITELITKPLVEELQELPESIPENIIEIDPPGEDPWRKQICLGKDLFGCVQSTNGKTEIINLLPVLRDLKKIVENPKKAKVHVWSKEWLENSGIEIKI